MSGLRLWCSSHEHKKGTGTITAREWRAKAIKEKDVRKAVKDLCAVHGWHYRYIVQSALSDPGLPDVLVGVKGLGWVCVELKKPGERLTDDQVEFQRQCFQVGAAHLVVTDSTQLEEYVKGVLRSTKARKPKPVYPITGDTP